MLVVLFWLLQILFMDEYKLYFDFIVPSKIYDYFFRLFQYDQYKTPMENIGLQDSLLSRFDLLFVMLDVIESEHDELIADHVVRMHRYRLNCRKTYIICIKL